MELKSRRLGLSLSGGGFRATFFHVGVIQELKRLGLLDRVTHLSGVSGGAITAAHLWLNWRRYLQSDSSFEEQVKQLKDFANSNVQSLILRRVTRYLKPSILFRSLGFIAGRPIQRPPSSGDLLEAAMTTLFTDTRTGQAATLACESDVERPRLSILSTSLESGLPIAFDTLGLFRVENGGGPDIGLPQPTPSLRHTVPIEIPLSQITIAKAVSASAAYPALISPISLSPSDPTKVVDGGVFDNLGVVWMDEFAQQSTLGRSFDHLLVSDAGIGRSYAPKTRSGLIEFVQRNLSTVDLIGRHLDESRHREPRVPRTYFHISEKNSGALDPCHPSLTPTTLSAMGEATYEMLRSHGKYVALRALS